jgi:hypothetical protein
MFNLRSPRFLVAFLAVALFYMPLSVYLAPTAFVTSNWWFVCGIGLFWAIVLAWPLVAKVVAARRRS